MDIMIKGMEMPKNCLECQFYTSEYDYCHVLKDNLSQKEWGSKSRCLLVELPSEHGRLKDESVIIDNMGKAFDKLFPLDGKHKQTIVSECHVEFLRAVFNAPTIVEGNLEASNGSDS